MSFLMEVLSSVEKTDLESGKRNLPIISEKIVKCKEEIDQYIDDVYVKFTEWPKKNEHLLNSTAQLSIEIQDLQNRIEQIAVKNVKTKICDVTGLLERLERSNIALGIVTKLIEVNESLVCIKDFEETGLYVKAAKELVNADECIKSIPREEVTEALDSLRLKVVSKKHELVLKVAELLEQNIKTTLIKSGTVQTNSIKVKKNYEELIVLLEILTSLQHVTVPLKTFAKFLTDSVCKPIITSITAVKVEEDDTFYNLTVAIKKSKSKIPYKDVFEKLIQVFTFVQANFDYKIDDFETIAYIGNQIKYDLSEIILNDCLSDTLPSSDDADCKIYKAVIEDIKVFQSKLVELKIFDTDSNPILDYANNMDIIFVNKQCHEYMTRAIVAMKKDLHDLVDVGVRHDAGNPLTMDEFPESSISRSTIEILELVQEILQKALTESDLSAARMICTVQSVFYQYGNIVHVHHQRLLQTIPQQVALFRNNCMYIAHQLTQLNKVYSSKFSSTALPLPPLFTDQVHQLKMVGGDIFLTYVEEQVKLMETTLQEFKFDTQHVSGRLHHDTDKCLRQCIRQNELLKTVWLKVLPHSVYNKTVGYLLNTFCKKLIEVVVAAEDIPSKNAEMLVELYKVVLTRGPKLFPDSQEICLYVEMWQKLNDLVFILGASLVDICDRWAEGKGPLTLSFTPDEVRNLIKALFQNTDRRTAALKTIHN